MTTSQIFTVKIILHFLNCCLISCCCLRGVCMFLCVPTGCQSSFRADCWAKPGQWKEIRTFKESQEHTCCFIPFKHQHHRHQHATPTPTPPHTQTHTASRMFVIMKYSCLCARERIWYRQKDKMKSRVLLCMKFSGGQRQNTISLFPWE